MKINSASPVIPFNNPFYFKRNLCDKSQYDKVSFNKNPCEIINERLKEKYSIDSNINNPTLLGYIFQAVEDFCSLNHNNKMFDRLELRYGVVDDKDVLFVPVEDYDTGQYTIVFNKAVDWKNIKKITENLYENAIIPSNNPKFPIYEALGDFINFKYNPYAHQLNSEAEYGNENYFDIYKICESLNIRRFNACYIASKMSGVNTPKFLREIYFENSTNTDLIFPKTQFEFKKGKIFHFNTIKEAEDYLKQYGVSAEFCALSQADDFTGAIEDLIELTGDKDIFKGLKVHPDLNQFFSTNTCAAFCYKYGIDKKPKSRIVLNPAHDWKKTKALARYSYDDGFRPTYLTKSDFIHELSHYIEYINNPESFMEQVKYDNENPRELTYTEKLIRSKVSGYATTNTREFCAEYISARLAGVKYPKAVDFEFIKNWKGKPLTFPD